MDGILNETPTTPVLAEEQPFEEGGVEVNNDVDYKDVQLPINEKNGLLAFQPMLNGVEEFVKEGKIEGKYNTFADLIKARKDLQTQYEALKNEKDSVKPVIPEEYDFAEVFEKTGLSIGDEEVFNSRMGKFKEMGFTQEQANAVLEMGAEWGEEIVAAFGPPFNKEAEINNLKQEWGNDWQQKAERTFTWAKENAPSEVWQAANTNAKVMQWLYGIATKEAPVNGLAKDGVTGQQAITKEYLWEKMQDPRYNLPGGDPVGDAYRQQVEKMFKEYTAKQKPFS